VLKKYSRIFHRFYGAYEVAWLSSRTTRSALPKLRDLCGQRHLGLCAISEVLRMLLFALLIFRMLSELRGPFRLDQGRWPEGWHLPLGKGIIGFFV